MGYIYDFDLGSILFFGLTMFFYLYQKRLRNLQDTIFTAMLFCSMTAVVFDFVAAAMEYHAMQHPIWLLYAVNILFMFGMQSCLPLFFLYAVASAGKFNRLFGWRRIACAAPYLVTMALLFLSPFVDFGICFVDAAHIYRHGPTHWMLYVNMGIYVVAGASVLLYNVRNIQRTQRNVILLFVLVLFLAMVLQLLFPRYLLTASATALSLTAVFYALQSPVDQLNPLTGAFSRTLLPALIQDYTERGREYTLLLFSIRSFDEFVRLYGNDGGDALLRAFSEKLMQRFLDCPVVFMDTSEFTVVHNGTLSRPEVEQLLLQAPESIEIGGLASARLELCLGAVSCEASDLAVADYILREMRFMKPGSVLYADEEYCRSCTMTLELEATLERTFNENGASAMLLEIVDANGETAFEEAQLGMPADTAAYVPPRRFLQLAAHSGAAWEYYRLLFTAISGRSGLYNAHRRLCIPLIPAAFLQEDAPKKLLDAAASFGFRPEQLLLSVGESDLAASESALIENIRRLASGGFALMIDAFAQGYTDMSLIASLPLSYARLHESIASNAAHSEAGAKLLKGLVSVLTDIGIEAVCSGIDTAAERQAAVAAGARLFQGPCATSGRTGAPVDAG